MEATYVRLFEKQAAYTPDAVAVTFADTSLTYSQLNKKCISGNNRQVKYKWRKHKGAEPGSLSC